MDTARVESASRRLASPLPFVGFVVFAVALASFARVPLLPDIGRELRLSAAEIGLLTTAFALGRLAMDLPAGRVADGLPPGRALAGSGLAVLAGGALLAAAASPAAAVGGMVVLGLASALTNTTAMTAFATGAPAHRRGTAMAGFTTALMSGQTLGPAIAGGLAGLAGWRAAQGSAAALGALVALACLLAPIGRAGERRRRGGPAEPAQDDIGRIEMVALAAVPFATFFAMGALPQTLIPLIGAQELGLSAAAIGLAIGVGGLARFGGALVSGVVSDRVSRKAALVPALVVMAAGVALLALPPARAPWFAALVLLSVASTGIAVAATIIADRVPAGTVGRRLGTFRFMGDGGLLAGPALAAVLYEQAGRAAAMAAVAGVLLAAALASATLVAEPRAAGAPALPGGEA